MLSTRLRSHGTPFYQKAIENISIIKDITIQEYWNSNYISLGEKIVFFIFYYCPFLFRLYYNTFIGLIDLMAKIKWHLVKNNKK